MAKKEPFYKGVNFKQFTNKDGLLKGGVEVKIPEEIPTKNKGEQVFYASANKGVIKGIEKRKHANKGGLMQGFPKLAKKI